MLARAAAALHADAVQAFGSWPAPHARPTAASFVLLVRQWRAVVAEQRLAVARATRQMSVGLERLLQAHARP